MVEADLFRTVIVATTSIDDQPPVVMSVVPETLSSHYTDRQWSAAVSANGLHPQSQHTVSNAGQHTLKVWMIDPGLVLEKLVIDTGGLRPSYLGPPERYRRK